MAVLRLYPKEYMKAGYKKTEEFENNGIRIEDLTSDEMKWTPSQGQFFS